MFGRIFHSSLIEACFQNKNIPSKCLKTLTTGAVLHYFKVTQKAP